MRAAVSYEDGIFRLPFFGTTYHVHWPDGTILRASDQREADVASRILMMHYLLTADGTPLGADWIAFRNLPGGLGYDGAFQGRASLRLAHAFGTDLSGFENAARALGGERLSFGDASFSFRLLPRENAGDAFGSALSEQLESLAVIEGQRLQIDVYMVNVTNMLPGPLHYAQSL